MESPMIHSVRPLSCRNRSHGVIVSAPRTSLRGGGAVRWAWVCVEAAALPAPILDARSPRGGALQPR